MMLFMKFFKTISQFFYMISPIFDILKPVSVLFICLFFVRQLYSIEPSNATVFAYLLIWKESINCLFSKVNYNTNSLPKTDLDI